MTEPDNPGPAETFSVGEFLTEEIQERGMSEVDFAAKLGWKLPKAHWLIYHEGMLLREDAERIAEVLGTGVEVWLNMQEEAWNEFDQFVNRWAAGVGPS